MIIIFDKNPESYEKFNAEYMQFFRKTPEQEKQYVDAILKELCEEFMRLGISPGYHVSAIGQEDASGWDGGLCMHQEDGYWLVYHSERGNRSRPEIFTNIQTAANYFLWTHVSRPDGRNTDVGFLPQLKG